MDYQNLVEEILRQVSSKLAQAEGTTEASAPQRQDLPGVLILAEQQGAGCPELLESSEVASRYRCTCALQEEYRCDLAEYDTVVLYGLNTTNLFKVANGIGDSPYTRFAVRAVLEGKRVLAVSDETELFGSVYSTAPKVYYDHLMDSVRLLKASGVAFCAKADLAATLCGAPCPKPQVAAQPAPSAGALELTKRVISERDVFDACQKGYGAIRVGKRAIITDLAKDYARDRGMVIERQ